MRNLTSQRAKPRVLGWAILLGAALAWREYLDEAGAWLAAAFTALCPLDVFFATEAHTDLPLAVLTAASVLCHLRGRRTGRTLDSLWAGLLLGAAHLVKESAFFGLAALTAVGGRPRRQDALVPAGFAAVVLLESGFYAAATGDPLFRINAIRTVQTSVMEALMTSEISTASRLSGALESMLLPWGAGFPFFGLGWPAALGGAAMILVKKERALYSPVTWLVATTLLLLFWPITVRPYRPAMMAHPRIFHVALAPMAVLAACLARRLPKLPGRATAGLIAAAAIPCAIVVHADGRRYSEGARRAFERLPAGSPVVSDPRTTGLFRIYDGGRQTRQWLSWNDAAPNQPYVRVANDRWISLLRSWYGENPPPSFAAGDARLLEEIQIPGRLSWRPLLAGRIAREPPTAVRLYLVEP